MINRRVFVLRTVAGMAAAGFGRLALADELALLREDDPQAIEFGYVSDTVKADEKKFPSHKAEQKCVKCQIYEDGPNGRGGCPIFAGKLVAAIGWCSAFS